MKKLHYRFLSMVLSTVMMLQMIGATSISALATEPINGISEDSQGQQPDLQDENDPNPFCDIKDTDWYYPYARYALDHQIMVGKGTNEHGLIRFDPLSNVTRAEFVQILYSKEGKPDVDFNSKFEDVKETDWFAKTISWAAENSIVVGKGDRFDTYGSITRQEIATILHKYAKNYLGYETDGRADLSTFADKDKISGWAVENMQWAVSYGIMKGKGDIIDPTASATRAESAAMIRNFVDAYEAEQNTKPLDTNDDDEDGLPNYYEEFLGTDKDKKDTDEDGLTDYEEIVFGGTDPTKPDSNQNGIIDSEEDEDGDGLSNLQEIELLTNPLEKDTDEDGLEDGDEVKVYFTDPKEPDSDGDKVTDGLEVQLGNDPAVYDGQFDVTAVAEDDDIVKVSVEAKLSGAQVDSLSVRRADWYCYIPEDLEGIVGGIYDFQVKGGIQEAVIRFEFPKELLEDPELQFCICHFNEEMQELEPVETTVEGNVASAKVSHFSPYLLIAGTRAVIEHIIQTVGWQPWTEAEPFLLEKDSELVIVIEDSSSMRINDPEWKRLEIAKEIIDRMPENCKIGIVQCVDAGARSFTNGLTKDKELLKSFLTTDNFWARSGCGFKLGENKAWSMLSLDDPEMTKQIVFMLDDSKIDLANHKYGTMAYWDNHVIGSACEFVADPYSETGLNNLVKKMDYAGTGGYYAQAKDEESVGRFIDELAVTACYVDDKTDSDEDGLLDLYEGCISKYGNTDIVLDPFAFDCDDDYLLDGEETQGIKYELNSDASKIRVKAKFKSNPGADDTDIDNLSDYDEVMIWETDPRNVDTDGDGLHDGFETFICFDPTESNADNDFRNDSQEWDAGSNPRQYDKNKIDFTISFTKGFFAGDFIQDPEDFPMLAGQILSSLIPFVDARDVAGNLYHGNYVMAGFSAVGLIPYAGDTVKFAKKVANFAVKNMDNVPETAKVLKFATINFPEGVSAFSHSDEVADAMSKLAHSDLDKLTKAEFETLEEFFEKVGLNGLIKNEGKTLTFTNWDDMKKAFKGTTTQFLRKLKPKHAPSIKKWLKNGGKIEIATIDGKSVWTFTNKVGDSVPYIDGYVVFPEKYLYPGIKAIDIGTFTGDRAKDKEILLKVLRNKYKIPGIPEGYTPHHDVVNGVYQLVQETIHKEFTHIGGFSIFK